MTYLIATLSQLGIAVKNARKTMGLTQAEAAARVGLLPKTISALENHPESCAIGSLFRLLAVLDLELSLANKTETLKGGASNYHSKKRRDQEGW